jgi:alcohol dehydrogenase class IV
MTKRIGYKLNPNKLKKAPQSILPYVFGAFYYTEDFEYFDVIKPYLDIPEPPKSLEEIQQELDEKFEKLIEKTHLEYRIGHTWLYKKKRYEEFCKKQDEDFEYAKEHGQFPLKPKFTIGTTLSANSNITSTFVIKQGKKHEGYYTIGNGYLRFYMPYKPNAITLWFVDKLFSIRWVDEKND